jgi:hypothetical protein
VENRLAEGADGVGQLLFAHERDMAPEEQV